MTRRAAFFAIVLTAAALFVASAAAQLQTPAPDVTAESESWYLSGAPINVGGTLYYPSGPVVHFNRNEMVFTGLFERVPVYKRTTQEPGSIVYVPLSGGLVRPYERRRSGELAGTVGSAAPSFPVVLPATEARSATGPEFFGVPTPVIPRPVGTTGFLYGFAETEPEPQPVGAFASSVPSAVGTTGVADEPMSLSSTVGRSAPARVQTVQRPVGLNGMFVQFGNQRWFADGPAVEFSPEQFTRTGEYHGFAVYSESGRPDRIYVGTVAGDAALVAPYRAR